MSAFQRRVLPIIALLAFDKLELSDGRNKQMSEIRYLCDLDDTSARILSWTPATWLTLDLKTASYIRINLFKNQTELQPLECQFLVSLGSQFAPKKKIESVTTSFSQAWTKVPFFRLNKDQTLV